MHTSIKHLRSGGFTIVELLVVIIVIGILAAIGIITYSGVQARAIDKSVQSDADSLSGAETRYALNNNAGGKAWYSGVSGTNGAADTDLSFTPSKGNVIDVVINSMNNAYCIRVYNPSSATFKTLATAATYESTPGTCTTLPASAAAQAASPIPVIPNGGVVTTLAGSGTSGSTNDTGPAASFNHPYGVATDSSGNVYVADAFNNLIRTITPAGVVTTLAGSGSSGSTNGTGTAASFQFPNDVATDSSGNVYVADTFNNLIRKITPAGVVTTLAGSGSSGSTNGTGTAASFNTPAGVATDSSGNVYVADTNNQMIRKITPAGVVTTLAGSGSSGFTNGTGTAASFAYPKGLATDSSGNVYVADGNNYVIRKITPAGVVTTFAGTTYGFANGAATAAKFKGPSYVATDTSGNVYVSDSGSEMIRKIANDGTVTTLAGSGSYGSTNGTGAAASFNGPLGIASDSSGNLYIGDNYNNMIRKIQ